MLTGKPVVTVALIRRKVVRMADPSGSYPAIQFKSIELLGRGGKVKLPTSLARES